MIERLRALGVPNEAIPGVMELIDEERSEAVRPRTSTERSRAHRAKKRDDYATETSQFRPPSVANSLHLRPEIVANDPSRICARVLHREEVKSLVKDLPTVVRKTDDFFPETIPPARTEPTIVSDVRKTKKAYESRMLDFVGEGWNALAADFPRMVRLTVIQDDSPRERAILSRSRELLKDFDFEDAELGWKSFFAKIRASPFLRGEAPPSGARERPFKPRIDAIIAPQMFLKIMEDQFVEEVQFSRKSAANGYAAHR